MTPSAINDDNAPAAPYDRWRRDEGRLVIETGLFGDLVLPPNADSAEADRLIARAKMYASQSLAKNTRIAYAQAWRRYCVWCADVLAVAPLNSDPAIIGMHLAALADPRPRVLPDGSTISPKPLARKTIRLALDAIAMAHRWAGLHLDTRHPAISLVFEGVLRSRAGEEERKAEPILLPMLRKMVDAADDGPKGARDRLLILLGWSAGLRRSELTALNVGDVKCAPQGLLVAIKRAKSDQRGDGALVGVERSPDPTLDVGRALDDWLLVRPDADANGGAPLFVSLLRNGLPSGERLSGHSAAVIVSDLAQKADPEAVRQAKLRGNTFSAHSLRAGVATEAGRAGAQIQDIMRHLRHSKPDTTAAYMREVDVWRGSVTGAIWRAERP